MNLGLQSGGAMLLQAGGALLLNIEAPYVPVDVSARAVLEVSTGGSVRGAVSGGVVRGRSDGHMTGRKL